MPAPIRAAVAADRGAAIRASRADNSLDDDSAEEARHVEEGTLLAPDVRETGEKAVVAMGRKITAENFILHRTATVLLRNSHKMCR